MGKGGILLRLRRRGAQVHDAVGSDADAGPRHSTIPAAMTPERLRRGVLGRRTGVVLLAALLVAGLSGALGQRQATVRDSADGVTLEMEYPRVTRPGLDSPWSITVQRDGGFDGPVQVRMTSSYFDLFDENGLDPDAAKNTQDETWTIWEFEPPPGDTLTVDFDARLSPAIQSGDAGTTQVLDAAGEPIVSVDHKTVVVP